MALNFGYDKPTGLSQTATSPAADYSINDPWNHVHQGIVQANGRVWFPDPANEREGTASLDYGFASSPDQIIDQYSTPGSTSNVGQGNYWLHHMADDIKHGVINNGQSGFTLSADNAALMSQGNSGIFAQTGRDNGKYAVHSSGLFGGFGGVLLGIGLAYLTGGLSTALAGGAATLGSDIAAGAIIGGASAAVTGGDVVKGIISGGVGGGIGNVAGGWADAAGATTDAVGNVGHLAAQRAISGAATGATHGLLNGGGFGSVLSGTVKGTVAGATSGAVQGSLVDSGVTNPDVLRAAGGVTSAAVNTAMNGTPSTNTTTTNTQSVTHSNTINTAGVSFGSIIPTFQPTARQNMNWGTRLAGT